ncbi:MAG: sulfide/dihydroorotate dehydrogenase-like FAD/NAD-binding protein [Polyangiaceae bacterium]|jgi:ferredoxin--NADP+ reductase|nr:sulfide/dihydroorotate dehydrogenase-like FAD/NAD-binding protein [Polyangiaceae bacterium]
MTVKPPVEESLLIDKQFLAPKVTKYVVSAPDIARRRRPGQFVIVRMHQESERIPLTIADADPAAGTITLIVQEVGKSTAEMAHGIQVGDKFADVVGPLGMPTHIEKVGRVIAVGGGIGIAPLHPIVQGMRKAGNEVIGVLGARTKDLLILEQEMRRACHRVRVVTDDGSYGDKGLVTDAIRAEVEAHGKPALCVAIGPLVMMREVSKLTKQLGIKTLVSLNPIMVDGTGMCGGCRVTVNSEVKFVCVDGPEFDAHGVDFDELLRRQRFYTPQESESYQTFLREHPHDAKDCKLRQMADAAVAKRNG